MKLTSTNHDLFWLVPIFHPLIEMVRKSESFNWDDSQVDSRFFFTGLKPPSSFVGFMLDPLLNKTHWQCLGDFTVQWSPNAGRATPLWISGAAEQKTCVDGGRSKFVPQVWPNVWPKDVTNNLFLWRPHTNSAKTACKWLSRCFNLQDALYVNMREQIDKKAIQKRSERPGVPEKIGRKQRDWMKWKRKNAQHQATTAQPLQVGWQKCFWFGYFIQTKCLQNTTEIFMWLSQLPSKWHFPRSF